MSSDADVYVLERFKNCSISGSLCKVPTVIAPSPADLLEGKRDASHRKWESAFAGRRQQWAALAATETAEQGTAGARIPYRGGVPAPNRDRTQARRSLWSSRCAGDPNGLEARIT